MKVEQNPNKVSPSFCTLAFNQIHVTPMGVVKPCCIFDGGLKTESGASLRIGDGNLEQVWNAKAFKDLRLKMLNGEAIPECVKCMEEEKAYATSDRIRSYYEGPELFSLLDESKNAQGAVAKLPFLVNLKIGNICNLKCRMCQPLDSCMVDSEFKEISKEKPQFRHFDNANAFDYNFDMEPIAVAGNWIEDAVANENLKKLLVNTREMSLAGGEITFTKEAMSFLKFCVEEGFSKNIDLVISSNLTKVNDEIINLFASFKSSRIAVSIDGKENVLEYIRYPSKWSVIYANLIKLVNAPANVIPVFAPTVQIYNVLSITDVFLLMEEIKSSKWEKVSPCHLTILFDPQHLNIRHLPKHIREIALERLRTFYAKSYYVKKHQVYNEQFNLLLETLAQDHFDDGRNSSQSYLNFFMQYTQDLDEKRSQRMQDFLPELYELLSHHPINAAYPNPGIKSYTFYRYQNRGFHYQSQNDWKKSMEMFNEALALEKDDDHSLFGQGINYKMLGDFGKAFEHFTRLYQVNKTHYYNLCELAFAEKSKGNIKKAIQYFEEAVVVEPADKINFAHEKIAECVKELK